jgi:hypothetical protein
MQTTFFDLYTAPDYNVFVGERLDLGAEIGQLQ